MSVWVLKPIWLGPISPASICLPGRCRWKTSAHTSTPPQAGTGKPKGNHGAYLFLILLHSLPSGSIYLYCRLHRKQPFKYQERKIAGNWDPLVWYLHASPAISQCHIAQRPKPNLIFRAPNYPASSSSGTLVPKWNAHARVLQLQLDHPGRMLASPFWCCPIFKQTLRWQCVQSPTGCLVLARHPQKGTDFAKV